MAWALAAVALAALVVAATGQLVDDRAAPVLTQGLTAAIAVSFTATAAVVLVGAPGHPVGALMAASGIVAAVSVVAASWSSWLPLAWTSQWSWCPPLGLIALALLFFPDGRLPSRRWVVLATVLAAATAIVTIALAVAAIDHPRSLVTTVDRTVSDRALLFLRIAAATAAIAAGGLLGVVALLVVRWRRADGQTRQQLACLLAAGLLAAVCLVLDALGLTGAWLAAAVVVPAAMTVAVLRFRLYRVDRLVTAAMVWLIMTLLVIAGFVGLVAAIRALGADPARASLVAAGLIAVAFDPLRRRIQRGADLLRYGQREPYEVLARLGELLGRTVEPHAVLPLLAGTIADSLQVPYVGVELETRDGPRLHVAHGSAGTPIEAFAMIAHGERIGRLLVATRSAENRFTARERGLLEDVALQAAAAAETARLIHDLRESRDGLIRAREEERRRLRRDLHDGVGPTLSGMAMQVSAARKTATQIRIRMILDNLAGDLQTCTVEVRRLVDRLRPAVLDRGLEAAIVAECRRFSTPELRVESHIEGDLAGLPAPVEVAIYRIVAEALTNVVRHSKAHACRVVIRRSAVLAIEVGDDGVGVPVVTRNGVGLESMRERAVELGGDFAVAPAYPTGTSIRIRLPLEPAAPRPGVGPE